MRISPLAAVIITLLFFGGIYYLYHRGILTAIFAHANLTGLAFFGTLGGIVISGLLFLVIKMAIPHNRK